MSARYWLAELPSSDAAFTPLHRAAEMDPEDFPGLEVAHRQAVLEATWGADLAVLDERAENLRELAARLAARLAERDDDGSDADHVHAAEVEALGYALGLTAVRVAIRTHQPARADMGVAS